MADMHRFPVTAAFRRNINEYSSDEMVAVKGPMSEVDRRSG